MVRERLPIDWGEARRLLQEGMQQASRQAKEFGRLARQEAERLRQQLSRAGSGGGGPSALSTFVRPNLGATPEPLRRLLEPIIAVTALCCMGLLLLVGASGMAVVLFAAALLYLIITHIFGIELDVKLPV